MARLHRNIVAILLMLSFAQGVSMRLWMHHWFHDKGLRTTSATHGSELKLACDCLQDASMPLHDYTSFELAVITAVRRPQYILREVPPPVSFSFYCSLRGPPSA